MKTLSTIISIACGLVLLGMVAMALFEVTPADLRTMAGAKAQATEQPTAAVAPAPTPFATVIIYQPAPIVYQQVGAQPAQIAPNQPPPPPTAEPAAPVVIQPQQVNVVIQRREGEQDVVTGSGACEVGGSVARRCGK